MLEVSADTVAFVGRLVSQFPELVPLLREHLDDQEGEILAHLFMADLERWVERELARQGDSPSDLIEQLLDFLEEAVRRNDEIAEVIHASFPEHLPRPGEPGAEIRTMLGPALSERLRQIG
jgi:hypothetical protein